MTPCDHAGRSGTVDETGYCDLCGHRPVDRPPEPSGPDTLVIGRPPTAGRGRAAAPERGGTRAEQGGIVSLPHLEIPHPSRLVQENLRPPRGGRICGKNGCPETVGPGHAGQGFRRKGFCPRCGTPFSFEPKLREGELVGGQYRVEGCLAHGGLGWVYLAKDEQLGDHVAVKGLLNPHDDRARELVDAERAAMVELDHPDIVRIRNFVRHPDPRGGEPTDYIVMEYVGGRSLHEIGVEARAGRAPLGGPFRVEHVVSYGLEILGAFGYLHERGLLYCDMKPANVIHGGTRIKLIDLGAVRRIGDRSSPVIGTQGFQVPHDEIRRHGLTVRSDLYTLGRTLGVLLEATQDASADPEGPGMESCRRAIARAAGSDSDDRFGSAAEMAEQLRGVLREILALRDGRERPEPSARFAPSPVLLDGGLGVVPPLLWWTAGLGDPQTRAGRLLENVLPAAPAVATGLPVPRVDPGDPAADFLGAVSASSPGMLLGKLAQFERRSAEIELLRCRACLDLADLDGAEGHLVRAEDLTAPGGRSAWSPVWHRGLLELARGEVSAARSRFDRVYAALPGESAPKLALGLCVEHLGDTRRAERLYEAVWRLDRSQASAAFGLARIRLAGAQRKEAVQILDEVPRVSRHHDAAQIAAIRVLLGRLPGTGADPDGLPAAEDFHEVLRRLPDLYIDGGEKDGDARNRLVAAVQEVALGRAAELRGLDGGPVLGAPVTERRLRRLLEQSLRGIARQTRNRGEHGAVIDYANAVRPRTLR